MRAMAYTGHGGPEVIEPIELPEPEVGPHDVSVAVKAAALNHLDLWVRRGWPGLELALPHVPGSDIAGVVERVGAAVAGWRPGDAVIVAPGAGCGACALCLDGDESLCPRYRIYGEQVPGGMRQRFAVPAGHLLPAPSGLSFAEAAALPLALVTAWRMVVVRGRLRPAETVLVQAAGSGVSTAAIQIGRSLGARVIAAGSTAAKREHALRLGAQAAVDSSQPAWRQQVKQLTGGRGVDLAVDHVGGERFEHSLACLRPGGRLVTCGATAGARVALELRHVFFKQLSIVGSTMGSRADLARALALVEAGQIKPVVDSLLPFAELRAGHRRLEERAAIGKVVLDVDGAGDRIARRSN
ncbi:MAG: zinc-binding dehydrogenase [Deltaproteobacteria bacterium]|nr:zinc-binding dehydrogenase [Deltaproteobacteria bacterium]